MIDDSLDDWLDESITAPWSESDSWRERYRLLQGALTDSENTLARVLRREKRFARFADRILGSELFTHFGCVSTGKVITDDCTCGYSALANEAFSIISELTIEREAEKSEMSRLKKLFKESPK